MIAFAVACVAFAHGGSVQQLQNYWEGTVSPEVREPPEDSDDAGSLKPLASVLLAATRPDLLGHNSLSLPFSTSPRSRSGNTLMGRGDKRSKRGKRFRGSWGVTRPKKPWRKPFRVTVGNYEYPHPTMLREKGHKFEPGEVAFEKDYALEEFDLRSVMATHFSDQEELYPFPSEDHPNANSALEASSEDSDEDVVTFEEEAPFSEEEEAFEEEAPFSEDALDDSIQDEEVSDSSED
jgi:ribosomal small subunit protein bTHX